MFTGDELYLENVHIPEYLNGTWNNHAPRRKRKLLLHRAELEKIAHKTRESGRTIVPLALYFKDGRAKVEIAIATGKKEYDKRHALRERQDNREAAARHERGQPAPTDTATTAATTANHRPRGPRPVSGCRDQRRGGTDERIEGGPPPARGRGGPTVSRDCSR